MEIRDFRLRELRSKDAVPFQCQRCGACCQDIKEQVMVEPMDAYHIAKHLRENGKPGIQVGDVISDYTTPAMLTMNYPIFMVNTTGPDSTCIFWKDGGCSIYPARMRVCRLYPFSVNTGERGRDFVWYQCMERPFHFSGPKIQVKDWFYQNFTKEERSVLQLESKTVPQIGYLLSLLEDGASSPGVMESLVFLIYFNYTLDEPFPPQYERNLKELLHRLRCFAGLPDA